MAILIELYQPKDIPEELTAEPLSLEDGGCYWYLFPFFQQVWLHTGKLIDLHERVNFRGAELEALDEALDEAEQATHEQPEAWEQKTGEMVLPEPRVYHDRITREDVLDVIDTLRDLVEMAIEGGGVIACRGE